MTPVSEPIRVLQLLQGLAIGGIERMVQACLDAGLPAPLMQLEDGGLWVTFGFAHAPAKTSVKTSVLPVT